MALLASIPRRLRKQLREREERYSPEEWLFHMRTSSA